MQYASIIASVASFFRLYLQEISIGIVTVSLVLIGPYLNKYIKQGTKQFHWLIRFTIFVIICSAGYGFITHYLFKWVYLALLHLNRAMLVYVIIAIYFVLAWLAKQQKEI
jgi:hypothetical protein